MSLTAYIQPAADLIKQSLAVVELAQRGGVAQAPFPHTHMNRDFHNRTMILHTLPTGLSLLSSLCSAPRPGESSEMPLSENPGGKG